MLHIKNVTWDIKRIGLSLLNGLAIIDVNKIEILFKYSKSIEMLNVRHLNF